MRHSSRHRIWRTALAASATTVLLAGSALGQGFDELPTSPAPSTAPFRAPLGTSPPNQPTSASRPENWPGQVIGGPQGGPAPIREAPPGPHSKLLESAQIVAKVGPEVILASDVIHLVLEYLLTNEQFAQLSGEEREQAKAYLAKQCLGAVVQAKLWVISARREIPPEKLTELETLTNKSFDTEQLPGKLKRFKVGSRSELDAKLHQEGTSIQAMRRGYFERSLASLWRRRQTDDDSEITHENMLTYYRDHAKDYEITPRARWEHLMVRFDRFDSKGAAYQSLASLGNQLQRGATLTALAKAHSHDPSASDGGQHDWTTKDSLVSTVLDEAIFGLPVGQLSQILEDEQGFHIVRVLERQDLKRKAFTDVQKEIKGKIRDQRAQEKAEAYVEKLRREIPVWTILDSQPQTAANSPAPLR